MKKTFRILAALIAVLTFASCNGQKLTYQDFQEKVAAIEADGFDASNAKLSIRSVTIEDNAKSIETESYTYFKNSGLEAIVRPWKCTDVNGAIYEFYFSKDVSLVTENENSKYYSFLGSFTVVTESKNEAGEVIATATSKYNKYGKLVSYVSESDSKTTTVKISYYGD